MSQVLLLQGTAMHIPLQDASVHMVCTSPPYWGLRSYAGVMPGIWGGAPACVHVWPTLELPHGRRGKLGISGTGGNLHPTLDATGSGAGSGTSGSLCQHCGAWRGMLGLEPLHDCLGWARGEAPCAGCFVCHMRSIFREVWRVLRPDGCLFLNLGDSYSTQAGQGFVPGGGGQGNRWKRDLCDTWQPNRAKVPGLKPKDLVGAPWRIALALQADGWYLRSEIIWHKTNPMPESVTDRPTRAHEQVFLLSKRAQYFYDAEAIRETLAVNYGSAEEYAKRWGKPGFYHADNSDPKGGGFRGLGGSPSGFNPDGRNARTVWTLPTEPTAMAHFATFPTALVDRCLRAGTSAYGCCAQCGAPWQRVVSRERLLDGATLVTGTHSRPGEAHRITANGMGHWRISTHTTEHGWQASCPCNAGVTPAMVLDPFVGSGTTLLAARALGRHGVGLDLSLSYLRGIARKRLGLADLAAWEGRERPRESVDFGDLPLFQEASHG